MADVGKLLVGGAIGAVGGWLAYRLYEEVTGEPPIKSKGESSTEAITRGDPLVGGALGGVTEGSGCVPRVGKQVNFYQVYWVQMGRLGLRFGMGADGHPLISAACYRELADLWLARVGNFSRDKFWEGYRLGAYGASLYDVSRDFVRAVEGYNAAVYEVRRWRATAAAEAAALANLPAGSLGSAGGSLSNFADPNASYDWSAPGGAAGRPWSSRGEALNALSHLARSLQGTAFVATLDPGYGVLEEGAKFLSAVASDAANLAADTAGGLAKTAGDLAGGALSALATGVLPIVILGVVGYLLLRK